MQSLAYWKYNKYQQQLLLGAAVTPLNVAEYEFIYPENLLAMGISANTNVGTTALQLELTYRPDFPLATDGSDQGQQLV